MDDSRKFGTAYYHCGLRRRAHTVVEMVTELTIRVENGWYGEEALGVIARAAGECEVLRDSLRGLGETLRAFRLTEEADGG